MAEKINDGGPAFPDIGDGWGGGGMSLRDYFAGQIVMGMVAGDEGFRDAIYGGGPILADEYMKDIWIAADAMLMAREGKDG